MLGFWAGLGGGIGAVARFGIGGWVTTWAFAVFPWGTLAVNVLGSLALGFLSRSLAAAARPVHTRVFFTVGLCGGFTTFSTFDFEVLALIQRGDFVLAATYALGSVAACIAGVMLGARLATVTARRNPAIGAPG